MEFGSAQHEVEPLVICPAGDLDFRSVGDVRDVIEYGLSSNIRGLIISLEGVSFLDSTGLSVLVGAWKKAREIGLPFRIVSTNESIRASFRIKGLDKVMKLCASVPEALAAVASEPGAACREGLAVGE